MYNKNNNKIKYRKNNNNYVTIKIHLYMQKIIQNRYY